jgi:hypothetical protein
MADWEEESMLPMKTFSPLQPVESDLRSMLGIEISVQGQGRREKLGLQRTPRGRAQEGLS